MIKSAFREIHRLYTLYEEMPILLTSRKYNFQAKFDLPVYKLLPLSDNLILDFLQRNMSSESVGRQFFDD